MPADAAPAAAPVTAGVTLALVVAISLRATGALRLWAAALGLEVGSLVGGLVFGIYDSERVLEAAWVGLPPFAWPGIDLSLGPDFWALLRHYASSVRHQQFHDTNVITVRVGPAASM